MSRRRTGPDAPIYHDNCQVCGGGLTGKQRSYCSRPCKVRAGQRRIVAEGRRLEADRARYRENRSDKLEWQRAYYEANKPDRAAYAAKWRRENPDKRRVSHQKRRGLKLGNPGYIEVTEREWVRIKNQYGGRCAYCGEICDATMDHVVPLCKGGRHAPANILPACGPCNSRKQHRLLSAWKLEQRKAGTRYALQA